MTEERLFWVSIEVEYLGEAIVGQDEEGHDVPNQEYWAAEHRLTKALGPFQHIATGSSSLDGRVVMLGGRRGADQLAVLTDQWERLQTVADDFGVDDAVIRIAPFDKAPRMYAPHTLPEGQELPDDSVLIGDLWYQYQPVDGK